jgi:hypothetical protein
VTVRLGAACIPRYRVLMTQGGPPPGGEIIANKWLRIDGRYYYCRGWRPNGEPRIIPMTHPPHGKTVWTLEPTGAWTSEHLPFRLKDGTKAWLCIALAALLVIPWLFSGHPVIIGRVAAAIAVGICLLAALLVQVSHLYPHDDISLAEAQQAAAEAYEQSQHVAARRAAHQQAQAAQQAAQWQAAVWAQVAHINQAQHPGQDTYRPYGQSPPL